MVDITEKNIAFAAIGLGIVGTVLSFTRSAEIGTTMMFLLILIGILSVALTYGVFMAAYFIMPFITRALRVSEDLSEGYRIPPSQDVVVRNVGGIYQATMFMAAKFFEAAVAGVEEEAGTSYMELWERNLAALRFPMKFSIIAYLEDVVKYREGIETQRATAQIKLGKEREKPNPDALTMDKWEREKERLNAMLARLTAGEKPMGVLMYVSTMGLGVNEESAIAQVKKQVEEIRATVANALNLDMVPLNGEDMKKCFRWEFMIPPEPKTFFAQV